MEKFFTLNWTHIVLFSLSSKGHMLSHGEQIYRFYMGQIMNTNEVLEKE